MPRLRQDLALADSACPICGEACKLLLPTTAGNYAFSCIIHHDFEVTKAGMEKKGRKLRVMRWEAALGQAKKRAWNWQTMH
jgi:hypothetical protein